MLVVAIVARRAIAIAPLLGATLWLTGCAHLMPTTPELSMRPQPGSEDVDPRNPVIVEARGLGSRLTKVEVRDETGKELGGKRENNRFQSSAPLAFGTRYRVAIAAENALGTQRVSQELTFTTVGIPRLEETGPLVPSADGAVDLHFDRPVGRVRPAGAGVVEVQADAQRRALRLVLQPDMSATPLPVKLEWQTATGVPLPPLEIELAPKAAAARLHAKLDLQGRKDVGLALPLALTISGPVSDKESVPRQLTVRTVEGAAVPGRWSWVGDRRVRFTPEAHWPPSSTIEVVASSGPLDAGPVGSFSTGPDRRIAVYLDSQRVVALEDGKVVRSFKASTGKPATPTVTGSFYIYARYPLKTMKSDAKPGEPGHYVVENVPYAQYFHRDYALHGAWWHNGFGRPASHGCINLATRTRNRRWPNSPEDAGWLYEWASLGVPVTVYAKAPAL